MNLKPESPPSADGDRLIQVREVIRLTSLSRTSIYRMVADGRFPRPLKIGASRKAWSLSAVRQWIAERIAEANVA